MPLVGQVCSRGVWDETIPGIVFDENGVSNYARLFDRLAEAYPRGEKGKMDWEVMVGKMKKYGRNKRYDCIIGVSGGTDSSYLLHLAREYGLRPLAVNLDNGWSSDISVKNIKKMTNALSIDLETYVIDYEEIKDLLRSYMLAGLPWIDMPTDLAIKAVLYKIASRESIKYVLRGNDFRSEGTQPTEWTYGDGKQLSHIHKKYGKVRLRTFPNYTLFNLFYYGFLRGIKSIYPFYYLDYNKTTTQDFLKKEYNWEYYGGHHHENLFTKFAISYWLFEKFGIDKRKITYSAQILSGEINRESVFSIMEKLPYDKSEAGQMIDYVIKKLDLTKEEFNVLMSSPNKSFRDYPSHINFLNKMISITAPAMKLIFLHKPQSLYRSETIKM
jgi:N-acetyl sugar amidotransferase